LTPTQTAQPTVSPTGTTLPTYSPEELRKIISDLFSNNGGCRLPCLLGQIPSSTSIESFLAIGDRLGSVSKEGDIFVDLSEFGDVGGLDIILWNDQIRISSGLEYWRKEDKIEFLRLSADAYQEQKNGEYPISKSVYGDPFFRDLFGYYLLPEILSNYGKPAQVYLLPLFFEEERWPKDSRKPFSIFLYYPENGFLVEYVLPQIDTIDHFAACPHEAGNFSIISWSPEQQVYLLDLAKHADGLGLNVLNLQYFKTIEEATSLNLDEFYQIFKLPNSRRCIETPTEIWKFQGFENTNLRG
jgi:hypothetical protein